MKSWRDMELLCFDVSTHNLTRLLVYVYDYPDVHRLNRRLLIDYLSRYKIIQALHQIRELPTGERSGAVDGFIVLDKEKYRQQSFDEVKLLLPAFDKGDKCPLCSVRDKLVLHHWFDEEQHCQTEYVCTCCNGKLVGCVFGMDNHELPSWEEQKKFILGDREGRRRVLKELLGEMISVQL